MIASQSRARRSTHGIFQGVVVVDFSLAQRVLVTAGVQIDPGLTAKEVARIEGTFGFRFPPDLRDFLSLGLPISSSWVDWRKSDEKTIRSRMDWPLEGICFDIEHNAFWLDEWGEKPNNLNAAFEIARLHVHRAPTLIPIFSHRYVPAEPHLAGNPIFSVHQTDIIYYGTDLMDYLQNEFSDYFGRSGYTLTGIPRTIPLWSMLVES